MKPKLRPERLYEGDNGRVFCGALSCAGMSAHFTGRDLSGALVRRLTPDDQAAFASLGAAMRCEGCGRT